MTTWYSAPREGSKVASLTLDEKAKIVFSEAVAVDGENYISVTAWVEECSGVVNLADKNSNPLPCLASFRLNKKDWESEYQGRKKEYKTSEAMRYAIAEIESFGYEKPFSGYLDLSIPEPMIQALTTGAYGDKKLDEMQLVMMKDSYIKLSPVELSKFTMDDLVKPSSGGFSRGFKGQSEKQKILDRFEAMKELLGEDFKECKSLPEMASMLSVLKLDDSSLYDQLYYLMKLFIV